MPYTVSVERLLQEKPVGLIACVDVDNTFDSEKKAQFEQVGLPFMALSICSSGDDHCAVAETAVEFCRHKCGCKRRWRLDNFIDEAVEEIRAQVGEEKVVLGLSGGVDSSVVAALIHKAIGKQLTCVFVNHGLLRKDEPEMVQEIFARNFDMNLCYVDASERFLGKLQEVRILSKSARLSGKSLLRCLPRLRPGLMHRFWDKGPFILIFWRAFRSMAIRPG